MHHKNIKVIVKRQLKKDHLNWRSLTKKEKKVLSKQVTEAVTNDYDFKQEIDTPIEELIDIDNQIINDDIITLDEMNAMIDDFYKKIETQKAVTKSSMEIAKEALKADVLIAAPVAKSHSATGVSLSMKGMMGAY